MLHEPKLLTREPPSWRGSLAISSLVWGVAALYTLGRSWLEGRWLQLDSLFVPTLGAELRALVVWALATPLILASARRFPLSHRRWRRHLLIHLAGSVVFIYLLQVFVALPRLLSGDLDLAALGRHGLTAFLAYYHLAVMVYAIILVVGFVIEARRGADSDPSTKEMPAATAVPTPALDKLAVKTRDGILVIDTGEIDWIEADGDYARLHAGERDVLLRESLKSLEERLDRARFVRIHRSTIVSVDRVRRLRPHVHGDYAVVLDDGTELRLSRTRREALASRIDHPL